MSTNIEYPGLPKWPAMIVRGEKITEEQVWELIIRLSNYRYSWFNPNGGMGLVNEFREAAFLVPYEQSFDKLRHELDLPQEKVTQLTRRHIAEENQLWDEGINALREIEYFGLSSMVSSSFAFGCYGWVSWNGEFDQPSYNIGKWPDAEEVESEWKAIAHAFPFLDITCQLCTKEANEYDNDPLAYQDDVVIQFKIKDGEVSTSVEDFEDLGPMKFFSETAILRRMMLGHDDHGCSPDKLRSMIMFVLEKNMGRQKALEYSKFLEVNKMGGV